MRFAFLSVDPIGLTTFDSFDPDSFSVMSGIAEGLIYVDSDGAVRPALATDWRRVSPLAMEFDLRRGVTFHDGSGFDADDVVATFEAHRSPTPSACGGGILAPIAAVTALDRYRVRVETTFPDAMLLRRLFFGQVYAKGALRAGGRAGVCRRPVATGAYRFVRWDRGRQIVLERHPQHWAGAATVDRLCLPIVRQKEWLGRLEAGEIDVAMNVDAHDAVRAGRTPGLVVASRASSNSQAFLLRNRGPLADVRVRRALNHALHRRLLVAITEHGLGAPQRSVATAHEQGFVECEAFRYSPDLARKLLAEAGHGGGFVLRGLVSETSTALYFAVREFLSRVGVRLEAEIVPVAEWMSRVVLGNLGGRPYDGDFAVTVMANPVNHALFLQFANFFSGGPGSLTRDGAFDAAFLAAATAVEPDEAAGAVARLERYNVEQALMLFTVQQQAHAVCRPGFEVTLPIGGMPTTATYWSLRAGAPASAGAEPPARPAGERDYALLLEGTSHLGTFYLPDSARFAAPAAERIWSNIVASQERWWLQNEPLLREVVTLAESKESLSNVLESTRRVAIAGYSDEGRTLFINRGYEALLGADPRPATERLPRAGPKSWPEVRAAVDATGSWLGPVDVEVGDRYRPFYLTVTPALDDERVRVGYTFVFSDFSGEEERIKNAAIRALLDNVPYALFACDALGRVLPGYSAKSLEFFRGASVEGQDLADLLGLGPAEADSFRACYSQVVDDFLPPEVTLAQLPRRLLSRGRTLGLSGSIMRDADGAASGVLFTLIDVTDLARAEHEAERLRGVVQVLRFRTSFEAFVREIDGELCALEARAASGEVEAAA
ncbi:MAG TPA: ABC transporter substrate-binding protein, partial [Polyangiaceae bacterium]|nr:ABC transporter substrate-binding protein [Polyangiaceae bacterium]